MPQRCATNEYIKTIGSPVESALTSGISSDGGRDTLNNEVIVIPVVVHVLYHTSLQNISDEQVLSQIRVLNNDYRRLNADTINTPLPFKNVAADTRLVFCLAKVDPNGRYTTGVIRKHTGEEVFLADDAMKFSSSGGDDAWDSKKYLNIWVCNLFGRTLGYSVYPGGPAGKDGVVIKCNVFGTTSNVAAPYNKGRTVTHEIGHWLGLKHLWGDADCGDDGIDDTPTQQTYNNYCPSFPHTSSCSINLYGDMFMNFMDFTDDACMNMFTQGQKNKMRSTFALGQPHNSFLNSFVCDSSLAQAGPLPVDTTVTASNVEISVYPNPFTNEVSVVSKNATSLIGKTIRLYDITGKLLSTQSIKLQKTTIRVNNLPAGMYFLKIEGTQKPQVFKLIKQPPGLF